MKQMKRREHRSMNPKSTATGGPVSYPVHREVLENKGCGGADPSDRKSSNKKGRR